MWTLPISTSLAPTPELCSQRTAGGSRSLAPGHPEQAPGTPTAQPPLKGSGPGVCLCGVEGCQSPQDARSQDPFLALAQVAQVLQLAWLGQLLHTPRSNGSIGPHSKDRVSQRVVQA